MHKSNAHAQLIKPIFFVHSIANMPYTLAQQRKIVRDLSVGQRAQLKMHILRGSGQTGSGLFGTLFRVLGPTVLREVAGPAYKATRKLVTGKGLRLAGSGRRRKPAARKKAPARRKRR
jgi:hypothetical protein